MGAGFEQVTHDLTVDGVAVQIAAIRRDGPKPPLVILHGFGSTKEDYADFVRQAAFDGYGFLAYDAPGSGRTECADLSRISIPFLVQTAQAVLAAEGIERFHLSGHSMGGLTALMLADAEPDRVLSFCDIEGNIAPEDCFLSRQIVEHADPDAQAFFDAFIARAHAAPAWSSALYAASLRHKVRAGAVRGIFTSMVDLSDNAGLMDRFLGLPCRKTFMFGEQNRTLSYLDHIRDNGVHLAEIPHCGHFPDVFEPACHVGRVRGTSEGPLRSASLPFDHTQRNAVSSINPDAVPGKGPGPLAGGCAPAMCISPQ